MKLLVSVPAFLSVSPFYLPAAAPAYEMQPPGESDSIATRLSPVSTSVLPANHTQGKGKKSVN